MVSMHVSTCPLMAGLSDGFNVFGGKPWLLLTITISYHVISVSVVFQNTIVRSMESCRSGATFWTATWTFALPRFWCRSLITSTTRHAPSVQLTLGYAKKKRTHRHMLHVCWLIAPGVIGRVLCPVSLSFSLSCPSQADHEMNKQWEAGVVECDPCPR